MSVDVADSDDDVVALAVQPVKPAKPPTAAPQKRAKEPRAPLPYGWIRKESKSKKGAYYYANILTGKEETPKMPPEDSQQRQAEYEAAEAELEAAKRQAAERRAAQKAMVDPDPEDSEKSDSEGSEDSTAEKVTGEDFAKWKAQEEQREKREVQLKTWPRVSELPPVPTVTDPCLDILKDDKWVERHTLSSSRQRWTLGRAVGEVDFVMNHPSISRQHASLSRGSAGIYLTDLNSGHGIFVEGFGTSTRLYYYHEPEG